MKNKCYIVHGVYGVDKVFTNEKAAKEYLDLVYGEFDQGEQGCCLITPRLYESVEEAIRTSPRYFIEKFKNMLKYSFNEITVYGFKEPKLLQCHYTLGLDKLKNIVCDGPKKLTSHVSKFECYGVNHVVTEEDFGLFEWKYKKVTKEIENLKKAIKYCEAVLAGKSCSNQQETEKTM